MLNPPTIIIDMKLNKNNKFFAEFVVLPSGELKVKKAQKHTKVNQYSKFWKTINARNFARAITSKKLVTR